MPKHIWMKKQTEILQNGCWCPHLMEENEITADDFERITHQKADTYFTHRNSVVVELVNTFPCNDQRAIYHFNF